MRARPLSSLLRLLAIGAIGFVLAAVNVVAIEDDAFIPPSRFFVSPEFSHRHYWYQQRPQIDAIVLGNSRTRSGIDPRVLSETLSSGLGEPVIVQSLASAGGFFPFYRTVIENVLRERRIKAVILGLSPRDLSFYDTRTETVHQKLVASSGYKLAHVPYFEPFRRLEAGIADLTAALVPALVKRNRVISALWPSSLQLPPEGWPLLSEILGRDFENMQADGADALPRDWDTVRRRLSGYPQRLPAMFNWRPRPGDESVDEWGSETSASPKTTTELQNHIASLEARWDAIRRGPLNAWRHDAACSASFLIDPRPGSPQELFFQLLASQGVAVFIVIPPAISFGSCEDSLAINQQMLAYLQGVSERYANVRTVIDLNNGFRHDFMSLAYFSDLEHMNRTGAARVSQALASQITPHWPRLIAKR
jgi:hypothetical protein